MQERQPAPGVWMRTRRRADRGPTDGDGPPPSRPVPRLVTARRRVGPRDYSFGVALAGAFAAVVVAFTTATIYSQTRGHTVDDAAVTIATGAAPVISHLSNARTTLSQVRVAEREHFEAVKRNLPGAIEPLSLAREALRAEVSSYDGPVDPATTAALAQVDAAAAGVIAADNADYSVLEQADARFRTAAENAGEALNSSIAAAAQQARALALHIREVSARMRQLTYVLNSVCGLATVLAAVLLARTLRRHQRLLREHQRFLENRSDELEAFSGRLAHDIRSSLAGVSLSLQHAQRLSSTDEHVGTVLARGLRHAERIVRLSDGLLGFARAGAAPEPGARAEVDEVVNDVVIGQQGAAAEAQIDVQIERGSTAPVACAPGVLTSLVGNLVTNAIKYMAGSPRRRLIVRSLDHGRFVRVEVEDSGPGVPAHLRSAIFEPYVRGADLSVPGMGLGLATVKRLAEGHGGQVGLHEPPGGGSVFWFELPRLGLGPVDQTAAPRTAAAAPITP
jgi:signal transduction histidine kinase